jgi:hypothetical protein
LAINVLSIRAVKTAIAVNKKPNKVAEIVAVNLAISN